MIKSKVFSILYDVDIQRKVLNYDDGLYFTATCEKVVKAKLSS